MYSHPSFTRRRALQSLAVLGLSAMSQAGHAQRPIARFAQVIDTSPSQQELSRDYSTGVRLAWAELGAARGPLAATPLVTLESDGSEASLQAVLARLREDASIVGLVGSVGDRLAVELVARTRAAGLQIPHIAPWMADSRHDADPSVFCLFPSRDVQLRHALGAVQGMGIDDVSVAFSSERDRAAYAGEIEALAKRLSLRVTLQAPAAGEDVRVLPARMKSQASGLVLFMGTSAELALLSQAMAALGQHRFVLSLSDVDYATLQQLSPGKGVPLILTQVVPHPVRSNLAVARDYRALLKKLFDEEPSPISLAGYMAGLYAGQAAQRAGGANGTSREALLGELRKRQPIELRGFRFDFSDGRRGSQYVTQTLLGSDGRLVG
jgi:ABC-type branched-subunit amino acid transport system substrate-binding protein